MPEKFIDYILSGLECHKLLQNILWPNERIQSRDLGQTRWPPLASCLHLCGWCTTCGVEKESPLCLGNGVQLLERPRHCSSIHWVCRWCNDLCHSPGRPLDDASIVTRILQSTWLISPKTKYFISSYGGKADPRWLPGQDGQILPQAPDTEFRYLDAYISLCA